MSCLIRLGVLLRNIPNWRPSILTSPRNLSLPVVSSYIQAPPCCSFSIAMKSIALPMERLRVGERNSGIGVLRLGMVNQHKDLLKPGDQCIGGGYYTFDFVSNRIILDRSSYDFGRPKWHLLESLKIPSTYRGLQLIYKYDDGFHDDFNVSGELQIEYYD